MDSIEFSISRLRILWEKGHSPELLAEVAFLYDQIVKSGSHEPVIDLGMKVIVPFEEVGTMVEYAMSNGYITAPKRGTFGGTITQKSLRILKQDVPQKRRKRLDSFKCPQCGEKMLKKIVYGMPGEDFDFKNNFVGGCMPGPEDIGCKNCEWTGFRSELDRV